VAEVAEPEPVAEVAEPEPEPVAEVAEPEPVVVAELPELPEVADVEAEREQVWRPDTPHYLPPPAVAEPPPSAVAPSAVEPPPSAVEPSAGEPPVDAVEPGDDDDVADLPPFPAQEDADLDFEPYRPGPDRRVYGQQWGDE
jgi:hypothetical protein